MQQYVRHIYDFEPYSPNVRGSGPPCPPGSYTYVIPQEGQITDVVGYNHCMHNTMSVCSDSVH